MKKAINVRGTMRLMKVGDSFWVQDKESTRDSVKATATKVKVETGYCFTTEYDKFGKRTLITRTA